MDNTPTVLAVGAAGHFAGLVVPELAKRGARVRGFIRDAKQSEDVRRNGATEIAVGDLRDQASLDSALQGIDAVFYIAPVFAPNEAELGRGIVEAAQRAGVRRFVFSSVIHPILSALSNHIAKAPVEEALVTSNMEYVLLHPALFFQNLAQNWPKITQTGTFAEPFSTETRFSRVDYRDVSEVAAIALTEDRLNFGTFELCADGHLNRNDIAQLMSEVLGKPIAAQKLSSDTVVEATQKSEGEEQAQGLKHMFDWYDEHGLLGNALTLRAILNREPRTLRAYLEELAAEPSPLS